MVEGLVAGTVILIGLVASLALINSSLRLALIAKDELIAANLAQEGIEIVRAIREENWIAGEPALVNNRLFPGDARVHYLQASLLPYVDTPLLFDASTGFYQYQSGGETPFRRRIRITQVSPTEIRVVAEVRWATRGLDYSVEVEDHLYDWLFD